jgi:hypothetical protein
MGVHLAALGETDGAVAVAEATAERVAEVRQVLPVLANRRFEVVARGPA